MRCQCTRFSMDHKDGRCTRKAKVFVKRDTRTIAVCEDCRLSKDTVLRDVESDE